MSSTLDVLSASPRRHRRHGLARWWLASLLVGCLLPASLHPLDALRGGERSVIICFWVPAILRAQSQWIAKKRRAMRQWVQTQVSQLPAVSSGSGYFPFITLRLMTTIDMHAPRGPPVLRPIR
ncbi:MULTISPECIES: hypothetical protein [Vreelandella]|uniref:Uncharacterized protein n=2 Tax=Vreelandella TaxID=3137766 RepID=A0A7C9NNY3_9GAMM|nr:MULTISPECIES: hypothetical protein [Halomonas]NDL69648.1 hypothetical protein [Halomonas alkaliphila]NYS43589.1 hypothetical protein [Halomonas zhaodongensis]